MQERASRLMLIWVLDAMNKRIDSYGVTTGFGVTSHRRIKQGAALQKKKLIKSLEDLQIFRDRLETYTSDYTIQVLVGVIIIYVEEGARKDHEFGSVEKGAKRRRVVLFLFCFFGLVKKINKKVRLTLKNKILAEGIGTFLFGLSTMFSREKRNSA